MGLVRTALFNWAFARHHGGTLVFRIEDTDAARDSEESYDQLLDSMRWLGFDWDEGPEVGGPHAPYRQSQRMDIYKDVAEKLLAGGYAYHCYCTTEELDTRREAARAAGKPSGYDGHCRDLTAEQTAAYEAEGRTSIVRFRMPDEALTFTDLVRGELTFQPENVPDYGIVRANGAPLYTLVNPVDDALMEITHVLRGEDLLSSTPRQIALYKALIELGIAKETLSSGTCRTSWARATRSSPSVTRRPRSTSTASAASSLRDCSTTFPCWAGRSPRTATSSPSRRWWRRSTSRTSTPTRHAST